MVVNKSLTIRSTSQKPIDTIIQAEDSGYSVFNVTADNVNINGFTIKNTGMHQSGIYLHGVQYCIIGNNTISNNAIGVVLNLSDNNMLEANTISHLWEM